MQQKKCSSKEHLQINASFFCIECQNYMCNKCEKIHSNLCTNHHLNNLIKIKYEIYTGICTKDRHYNELNYFCRTHNEIVCASYIAKIKGKGFGQHADCEVCFLKDIKEVKKIN